MLEQGFSANHKLPLRKLYRYECYIPCKICAEFLKAKGRLIQAAAYPVSTLEKSTPLYAAVVAISPAHITFVPLVCNVSSHVSCLPLYIRSRFLQRMSLLSVLDSKLTPVFSHARMSLNVSISYYSISVIYGPTPDNSHISIISDFNIEKTSI